MKFSRMNCLLMLADLVALVVGFWGPVLLRYVAGGSFSLGQYVEIIPMIFLFLFFFWVAGLYPGVLVARHEELKKTTLITIGGIGAFLAATFFLRTAEQYSRLALMGASIFAVVLLPLARTWVRSVFMRRSWWGVPAVFFGAEAEVTKYTEYFSQRPDLGIRVVGKIASEAFSVEETRDRLSHYATQHPMPMLFCVMEADSLDDGFVHWLEDQYRRILFVPRAMVQSLNVTVHDFGGRQFLQSHTKWHDPMRQRAKRLLDVTLIVLSAVVVFPVMGLIAALIKMQTPGPAIYRQKRLGHDGKHFYIYKFRTMVQDADAVLERYLRDNPELAKEWEETNKLQSDPRITKLGAILRKTSVDELPQLINVLKGEMSLVGPRPIVDDEILRYEGAFELYKRSYPGITGLWQISGRSDTTYEERVHLDTSYIRSWSVWLDLYILTRTFWVVLKGKGAY